MYNAVYEFMKYSKLVRSTTPKFYRSAYYDATLLCIIECSRRSVLSECLDTSRYGVLSPPENNLKTFDGEVGTRNRRVSATYFSSWIRVSFEVG